MTVSEVRVTFHVWNSSSILLLIINAPGKCPSKTSFKMIISIPRVKASFLTRKLIILKVFQQRYQLFTSCDI